MKRIIGIAAIAAVVFLGVSGASEAQTFVSRTINIPSATNYGTLWDSLGYAIGTAPFTFSELPSNNVKAGYLITIYCDDSSGSPDSVGFILQRSVANGAGDVGVTGTVNGPGATTDIAAGEWINCGANLGWAFGTNNKFPLIKYIPADSLIAYPIVPGERYRMAAYGGKAAGDHYTAGAYNFNVYITGAK